MALIGNGFRLLSNPMRGLFASSAAGAAGAYSVERSQWGKPGDLKNYWLGDASLSKFYGLPPGYNNPYAWMLPIKAGGMASTVFVTGTASVSTANLAGGVNGVAPLTGSGTISLANAIPAILATAGLTASGTLSADITALAQIQADLTASGAITAANAIPAILAVSALSGSGNGQPSPFYSKPSRAG